MGCKQRAAANQRQLLERGGSNSRAFMRARPPAQLVDDHETVAVRVSMAKKSFSTHACVRGSENLSGVASLRKHAASAISTIKVLASADKLSLAPASKCYSLKVADCITQKQTGSTKKTYQHDNKGGRRR